MLNLRRGELVPLYNPDGSPRAMAYVPMKALKRDNGAVSSTSDRASKVLKRAIALPCPYNSKLCMFAVWKEYCRHLDALPYEGDRAYQKVFHAYKPGHLANKNKPSSTTSHWAWTPLSRLSRKPW